MNLKFTKLLAYVNVTNSRDVFMQKRMMFGMLLSAIFAMATILPINAIETLRPEDFKEESWSKTIDFFGYARSYALAHGKTPPPENWEANLFMVYINASGFQLLYTGLINIKTDNASLTIPIQNFLEHYKTQKGKDVLMSSSFITLLAFNDTTTSLRPNWPDKNDNLYDSFSLGLNLEQYFPNSSHPALSSQTTVIPLTHSEDKLNWHWGMRYTNLTAVWWVFHPDPVNPRYETLPIAITTYEELTFTYNLTIDPTEHTATITANYVIGRMTNLWLIYWLFKIIPIVAHYNSTGTYKVDGERIADETIYQFLEKQNIKMSVVLYQNSLVLDHKTRNAFGNLNVTDAEVDVSSGSITTSTEDGEKVFESSFGRKKRYNLYNYTADPDEESFGTYDAVTRTPRIAGYSHNPIFNLHTVLLRLVPLTVAHMRPALYQEAKERITDMTRADYLYIISYPTYSGYKIEHDPTYTAYVEIQEDTGFLGGSTNLPVYLVIIGVAAIAIIGVAVVVKRKRQNVSEISQTSTATETR